MNADIKKLLSDGYPFRIKGNDGYDATLVGMQRLNDGDYMAVYRYPGGDCCHDLMEIETCFEVIEQDML